MTSHLHIFRHFVLVLLLITTTSCSSVWINKSGQLTAIINEVEESELHGVYTLMRENGYLMSVPQGTGVTEQEVWKEFKWGKAGDFEYPDLPLFYIYYQHLKDENKLRVSVIEFYNRGGGFSAEGLFRADHIMKVLKERFGDSLKVVVRSYYTGEH